jgi:hypothetical protein
MADEKPMDKKVVRSELSHQQELEIVHVPPDWESIRKIQLKVEHLVGTRQKEVSKPTEKK